MMNRLSHKIYSSEEPINLKSFHCLKGMDVISAQVSDHHPIIHNGVLFWNMMMQGKARLSQRGMSYNNGFGLIENDDHYRNRLRKVAEVIAEIMNRYPSIDAINLCEGPIQEAHIEILQQSLRQHDAMSKFIANSVFKDFFYKPNVKGFPNWGLLMLADQKYKVNEVACDFKHRETIYNKLANRFQIWELVDDLGKSKYLALGHFPFAGDEHTAKQENLSEFGTLYCNLISDILNHYSDQQFILCADFNLNPYLISEWQDRALDSIPNNNSILITSEDASKNKIDAVTVDAILLSTIEKQKLYWQVSRFGLFRNLIEEHQLAKSSLKMSR